MPLLDCHSLLPSRFSKAVGSAWIVICIAAHAILLAYGDWMHSPAVDEVGHLAAGFEHWDHGTFTLYRVDPPLIRLIATLPLLPLQIAGREEIGPTRSPFERREFDAGANLMIKNSKNIRLYFAIARWACIPISCLGAITCWHWATAIFGIAAGRLACSVWCFLPCILGWSQLITPDIGAAALGVTACYACRMWLLNPSWGSCILCGLAIGISLLTKFTLLIVLALIPIFWIISRRRLRTTDAFLPDIGKLILVAILAIFILNLGYGFEGSGRQLKTYEFLSTIFGGDNPQPALIINPRNRFADNVLGQIPIPLPENYLQGIDSIKHEFETGQWSFLRGENSRNGWWYYYLYAIVIKTPIGILVLAGLSLCQFICLPTYRASVFDEILLSVPIIAITLLVSFETGINQHLRYLSPAFPFLIIWISRCGKVFQVGNRFWKIVVSVCIASSILSSLWYFPHSLCYFNELVGGPTNGQSKLLESNMDWGQDLYSLRDWINNNPDKRPLFISLNVLYPPSAVIGEKFAPPIGLESCGKINEDHDVELEPKSGWYAIGATNLYTHNGVSFLRRFTPVDHIGYSINIYRVTDDDIEPKSPSAKLPINATTK